MPYVFFSRGCSPFTLSMSHFTQRWLKCGETDLSWGRGRSHLESLAPDSVDGSRKGEGGRCPQPGSKPAAVNWVCVFIKGLPAGSFFWRAEPQPCWQKLVLFRCGPAHKSTLCASETPWGMFSAFFLRLLRVPHCLYRLGFCLFHCVFKRT